MKYALIIVFVALVSCTRKQDTASVSDSAPSCAITTKELYRLADSIISNKTNKEIWNLNNPDTTHVFTVEDHFTDAKTKTRLMVMGGNAGLSAGSADNLMLLLSCKGKGYKVLWAGQAGAIDPSDIADLNNDGIKEIIVTISAMYMGECSDSYDIYTFRGGKKNNLFTTSGRSVILCGRDGILGQYKKGDTLETAFDCRIIKTGGAFAIREARATKIHNGGITDASVLAKLKIVRDTLITPIK